MFEFIIHYKDGSSTRWEFASQEEMFQAVLDHSEQPRNISELWAEFGPVVELGNIGGGE